MKIKYYYNRNGQNIFFCECEKDSCMDLAIKNEILKKTQFNAQKLLNHLPIQVSKVKSFNKKSILQELYPLHEEMSKLYGTDF